MLDTFKLFDRILGFSQLFNNFQGNRFLVYSCVLIQLHAEKLAVPTSATLSILLKLTCMYHVDNPEYFVVHDKWFLSGKWARKYYLYYDIFEKEQCFWKWRNTVSVDQKSGIVKDSVKNWHRNKTHETHWWSSFIICINRLVKLCEGIRHTMNNDVIASMSEMDVSNVTPTADFLNVESTAQTDPTDPADDAIWILTSTFIIFTMQSGEYYWQINALHNTHKSACDFWFINYCWLIEVAY